MSAHHSRSKNVFQGLVALPLICFMPLLLTDVIFKMLWLLGFDPMSKHGLQTVMKLASCYGLKASAQGSGKKQFVVVCYLLAYASVVL